MQAKAVGESEWQQDAEPGPGSGQSPRSGSPRRNRHSSRTAGALQESNAKFTHEQRLFWREVKTSAKIETKQRDARTGD
jgi:hypothetical protein